MKQKPQKRRKIPAHDNEDTEEEEVTQTIYNSAEARLAFRILTEGMEEEQEEVEEETQDSEYDGYYSDEDDIALIVQFVEPRASITDS